MAQRTITRRTLIRSAIGAALAAVVAACTGKERPGGLSPAPTDTATASPAATTPAAALTPTPTCIDGDEVTPGQTEGPYFTPNSPRKTNFRNDVSSGEKLSLSGAVVTTACVPIERALVDYWHCDAGGTYDNDGFKLRGHQFTDAKGVWKLDTILPGIYPGRTRHIHVKVQAPNKPILTTQLYFPGESQNASDGIFREECVIAMRSSADGKAGTFTFVLAV